MTEDEKNNLMRTAMIEFGLNFARYIKEVDRDMWQRAVDYAKDTTDVDGVEFNYPKDESEEDSEDADWWNDWLTGDTQ
jgi:hypothetical protein